MTNGVPMNHRPFLLILLVAAITRFALLFISQTHVHSDEAIIGLMGKHIAEGRVLPFYMYAQQYNAGAAWEAYFAAIPFSILGVGVITLKACMVILSLVTLALFYRMTVLWYDRRTALLATAVFALSPSLLKWHFQVRGYSWYFVSIPLLAVLFAALDSPSPARASKYFLFGLVSGLGLWSLELGLTVIAAFWALLAVRGRLSAGTASTAMYGLLAGYGPAIIYNLTHDYANWLQVFGKKTTGNWGSLFQFSTVYEVFFREMPKLFGSDTILWYYPETSVTGWVMYVAVLLALAAAIVPLFAQPSKILQSLTGKLPDHGEDKDVVVMVLTLACFVPYLVAPTRVPGYFLGGCFFLSVLIGRLLARSWAAPSRSFRVLGIAVSIAVLGCGATAIVNTATHNEIETLTSIDTQGTLRLARFPGSDLDRVERHLDQSRTPAVWTTLSFVYPLLFETRERLAASDAVFGWDHLVYPPEIPWRMPPPDRPATFVMETRSPLRPRVESECARLSGVPPRVTEYGTLTVIEQQPFAGPSR